MGNLFPPRHPSWNKEHGRLEQRSIARLAVSPEQIGLCGCYQVIAVLRVRIPIKDKKPTKDRPEPEVAYYVSSELVEKRSDESMLKAIRTHWSAVENGSHHRRDVTFGEDSSRIRTKGPAQILATLRNLAIGLFELELHHNRTNAKSLPSWRRILTPSKAASFFNK